MADHYPFLFTEKKLFAMFVAAVHMIGFILLAIFSGSIRDSLVENVDDLTDDVSPYRAKYMTAILIFTIGGAALHLMAIVGIFFEHLYITTVIALLEVATVVGALLEAILIHNIFWATFGVSVFLLALIALHIIDLMNINTPHEYSKPPSRGTPTTANAEDSE